MNKETIKQVAKRIMPLLLESYKCGKKDYIAGVWDKKKHKKEILEFYDKL